MAKKLNAMAGSKLFNNKVISVVLVLVFLILPQILDNPYLLHIFILIFLYAASAGAWNIIGGYGGQVSLGHVAFFGIGAYTTALLYNYFGITPWLGMLVGAVIAAVVSGLISYPCFKLRGPFFTLATLAFAEVLRLLCIWARPVTGGQVGVTILFKPSFLNFQFLGKAPYYYIAFLLMLVIYLVSLYIERSKFGYYLTALKEDHEAAEALGINTARCKLYATLISGFLTSICGSFYTQLLLFIEPHSVFTSTLSNQFAMMAVVGGSGTAIGPIIGSFILTPLNELLRGALGGKFMGLNFVIFGLILILVVTFMPNGIVGFCKSFSRKLLKKEGKKC
ncbi:MAG TPA: branched-chain amino acid ABC transporter permease [Anaerovoracaceae bacterium]|nr:branched-chain amino acid ABC transporter permease [Anaerovoracaceae bacterium]